ncbi:MAG: ester cyclase [Chloroflexi bacterium]|nr:MAG: ester cyclase [Chloroflexota bacterium]
MACCTPACLFAPGVAWPGEYPGEAEHMGKFEETSRKLADTFSRHDLEGLANVYAADAVAYDPMYPEPLRGRAAIKKDAATFLRGFPDLRFEIVSIFEKDDRNGAGEMRLTGTHTGPLETPTGDEVPPTNKRVDLKGGAFVRLNERGEIIEERRYYDVGTILRQLGIVPEKAPEPAGSRR